MRSTLGDIWEAGEEGRQTWMGQQPSIQPDSLTWPLPLRCELVSWPKGMSLGAKEKDVKPVRWKERTTEDWGQAIGICRDVRVGRCSHLSH